MAIKNIYESPTIADQIVFEILTPDASGCFSANPYKVSKVAIYFVERDFQNTVAGSQYENVIQNQDLADQLSVAKAAACLAATPENLATVARLQSLLDSSLREDVFYYKHATPVAVFGTEEDPAWIATDADNAFIENVPLDSEGNVQYGHFKLEWNPLGMREGDYFICWTWMPNIAGDTLSTNTNFSLFGQTQITTSIPTHFTNPVKYDTLMERYLPDMFKNFLGDADLTPEVLQEFNKAVAKAFTFLENLANQMVDLIDANATHEAFLQLLGNLFALKLKSGDPTLWRRQIKQAVKLYKQKGTLTGLTEALAEAGITLNKFTKLWQIISPYTWQEKFVVAEDQTSFELSKTIILPLDFDNFELFYRAVGEDDWTTLSSDYVNITNDEGITTVEWVGDNLSIDPIFLETGDEIRLIYEVNDVPGTEQQTLENYIRTLPLADLRDERVEPYPLKNWNVRVIEEDDVLFDLLISVKHPYYDPVIFGDIRTEFAYSENVYNMEEYNGSTRESTNPCDIDRNFIDICSSCQGSKYTVDLDIEEISNDRLVEAHEVLTEFLPFHAILHSINLSASMNEFVQSPIEEVQALVQYVGQDFVLSGNGQMIFNRYMENGLTTQQIKRDALALASTEVSLEDATGYNDTIVLYSDVVFFEGLPIIESSNILEILSPSSYQGDYTVSSPVKNYIEIAGITEPIITNQSFAFRLSNIVYSNSSTNIYQDDVFTLSDSVLSYSQLGVKSQHDGSPWKVKLIHSGYPVTQFEIINILPSGKLIIEDTGQTIPVANLSPINYEIYNNSGTLIATSTTGTLTYKRRGRVDVSSDTARDNISNFVKIGDYLVFGGIQYPINSFVSGQTHQFYIDNYAIGDVAGQTTQVYRRLVENVIGYLDYNGMKLNTSPINLETSLPIENGQNPPVSVFEDNSFKENYLVLIGTDYYSITDIDGFTVTLNGQKQNWTTLSNGGSAIVYSVIKHTKVPFTILDREYPEMDGHSFTYIDRRGSEIITSEIDTGLSMMMAMSLNAANDGNEVLDTTSQTEGITYKIELRDGTTEEGEI